MIRMAQKRGETLRDLAGSCSRSWEEISFSGRVASEMWSWGIQKPMIAVHPEPPNQMEVF
jgi:hypothetical protein